MVLHINFAVYASHAFHILCTLHIIRFIVIDDFMGFTRLTYNIIITFADSGSFSSSLISALK